MRLTTTLVLGTVVLLSASNEASAMDVQAGATAVTRQGADPCTFFSKAEIESAFGFPFGPPKKTAQPACMFYSPNSGTISIRFGDPVTRAQFDSLPMALGTSAEPVSGLGDTAFFYAGSLFVFKKGRQLIVHVSGEMTPQFRAALITLGKLGAGRLRPR